MKKPSLLACLVLLAFARPAWTEPANLSPNSPNAAADDQAEERPRVEEKLPPDARRRLRDVLSNYSRQYPDGEQIAERRRLMHDRMQERLNNADKNGVGSISRSEAQLRMPRLAREFDQIDLNGDNIITREEMQAARDRAAMAKRETARNENSSAESRAIKSQ